MFERVEITEGDITRFAVDAIVNAANSALRGGGGVDGAIHQAAGPELMEACRALGGCPPGEARITRGYALPARHVIHTVGPIWSGGRDDDAVLASCYRNSLSLAAAHGLRSIAFPAIGTGVYRFPFDRAARIALLTVEYTLREIDGIDRVVMVCFGAEAAERYRSIAAEFADI